MPLYKQDKQLKHSIPPEVPPHRQGKHQKKRSNSSEVSLHNQDKQHQKKYSSGPEMYSHYKQNNRTNKYSNDYDVPLYTPDSHQRKYSSGSKMALYTQESQLNKYGNTQEMPTYAQGEHQRQHNNGYEMPLYIKQDKQMQTHLNQQDYQQKNNSHPPELKLQFKQATSNKMMSWEDRVAKWTPNISWTEHDSKEMEDLCNEFAFLAADIDAGWR